MKLSKNESGNVVLAVGLGVVGLVVGYAISHGVDNNKIKESSTPTSSSSSAPAAVTSKAADLRTNLVTLGLQHMQLTNHAIDAALDGDKNATAIGAALYANGTDIGAAVGSVYGPDAESTFNTVWKLHLDQFVAYAVADSKGDEAGKQAALKSIDTNYTKPLAAFLAKANPNLPEATLNSLLSDHVNMTAQMIDSHVQGKYADEAAQLKAADQHIQGIFSALAGGIVKQFPAKFN